MDRPQFTYRLQFYDDATLDNDIYEEIANVMAFVINFKVFLTLKAESALCQFDTQRVLINVFK